MSRATHSRTLLCYAVALVWTIAAGRAAAQTSSPPPTPHANQAAAPQTSSLKQLSIEELLEVDVSLPLRRSERVMEVAAAISVLTSEDLRRIGAVTLPESLRTVSGLFVARFNASAWIATARGFASNSANKMLVMIDGRSVYSPLFSGVFWEQQDGMLLDMDRIEVIRGPGASLWGSNAVNGVINVVSKSAAETQGTLVTVGGGAEERFNASVRYGGRVGKGHFRVYGKYFDRDSAVLANGHDADDGQRFGQGGFRMDFGAPAQLLTIQGDSYTTRAGLADRDDLNARGANVLARWTRRPTKTSELQVQTYVDHTFRSVPQQFEESRDTVDVDVQHRWQLRANNILSLGGGYRYSTDDTVPTPLLFFDPEDRATNLVSAFAQDEMQWSPHIATIIGTKIEHNDYTGIEFQPTARLRWTPSRRHTVWGGVARAVRLPTRLDTDVRIRQNNIVLIAGNPDFHSESLVAYEVGYRAAPIPIAAISVLVFQHRFDDLRTQEPTGGTPPILIGNGLNAVTSGFTPGGSIQPRPWVRFTASYAFLHQRLRLDDTSRDLGRGLLETIDPRHQVQFLPFRVCLFGNNPFGGSLEAALAGETWPGGAILVERVGAVDEARDCHLLYVAAAVTERFLSSSAQLVGRPVLTIGESRRFLTRGGMIQLFLDANRVRFSVNQGAAEIAGLRVSSRLLRLAREVLEPPGGSR